MVSILEKIMDEFISMFRIGSKSNFEVKKRISKGLSGAEVYLIELSGNSTFTGIYFLKIDTDDTEYQKEENGYCFSNVVKFIKKEKIQDYYVILMQIAGQSSLEYVSFYDIESLTERRIAIKQIIPSILSESIKKRNYIGTEILPSKLFRKVLFSKLDAGRALEKYISSITRDEKVTDVTGFIFGKDICLPNAYAFAVNDSLWNGMLLRDTEGGNHGDFHGNNVFYSAEKGEYALIDMALYREDGYVFYDTAYFEISLLLHNAEQIGLMEWNEVVENIVNKNWDELNCLDKELYSEIENIENQWINGRLSKYESHKDSLIEARNLARVLAGLNYAGKTSVNIEIRRKAFIYACNYLNYILKIKKISIWKEKLVTWNEVSDDNIKNNRIDELIDVLDGFNDTKKYILVLGNQCVYSSEVYDALARVHWAGIISFAREEGIEKSMGKFTTVNAITVVNGLELVTKENLWCIYADGVHYNPETIFEPFPKWRNKYGKFLSKVAEKINVSIAPDELEIIVDVNSFSDSYKERLSKLYESLDLIENTNVDLALVCKDEKNIDNKGEYANISCKSYQTNLESVAEYCLKYLNGISEEDISIPSISGIRKPIPASDYNFIKNYIFVLHNRVLQDEGIVDELKKREFYYGQKILWQAIDEQIYVPREEYVVYKNMIMDEINAEHNQFSIRLRHMPGAGASVLCRVIGWELHEQYPVAMVESMNDNIIESIQKLYSLSGKHILLFLDGDFTDNDFNQILHQSRMKGIKVGIIYSYRHYDSKKEEILSYLTIKDGLKFMEVYSQKMKELKEYSDDVREQRRENMRKLATENALVNYRLPFFFGVNAFEEDYVSINGYLNGIFIQLGQESILKKIVNYMALITYYTEESGLSISYVRKILGIDNRVKLSDLLKQINGKLANFVYYSNGNFKICHSVVALDILKHQYGNLGSVQFEELLESFVSDLCECEDKDNISESLNNLFMNLFIKRDIEGDISDNFKKKNFSPVILALDNPNLQEKFFSFLIKKIPNNAHFRQHYGRLIIYNNPIKLSEAKEQFDKAIELEPLNPLHYHARGNMYTKYVIHLCKNVYKESTEMQLYDTTAIITQEAIEDYEESIRLICECSDTYMDLSYPYASIVQTVTYVVHQLYMRNKSENDEKKFLSLDTAVSRWCKELINKAEVYDIDTEQRYDVIRENDFYKEVRRYLVKYRYSSEEIQKRMKKNPDDIGLLKDYLYTVGKGVVKWEKHDQDELANIIECCKKLISQEGNECSEGILWRWFNASINYKNSKIVEMLAVLETLDKDETLLSAQFMLYVIKLGIYIKDCAEDTLNKALHHMRNCIKLSKDSNRTNTRFYYSEMNALGLCYDKENGKTFKGTVINWEGLQSAYLSLEINPKLTAFFVPSIIGMKKEGAVGTRVSFKLGVSYSGLRAWEVQIIKEDE